MNKANILSKQVKILWGKSGNKCANCKADLTEEKTDGGDYTIGIMAHIEGEKPKAARYNPLMSASDRSKYENLILLCPNCHTRVDNDEEIYTVDKLRTIKRGHEKWIQESLRSQMANVTFAELEVILKYLSTTAMPVSDEAMTLIPPKQKIKRNDLSQQIEMLITIGMVQVKQVKEYLNKNLDLQYAERLKMRFVNKYLDLKNQMLESDALFYALMDFASNNSSDFRTKAAGLSILTYFFELCEVFEK